MKKQVRFLLLLAALLVPWVTQAQLPTSINCTFENDSDTAGWVFVNGTQTNKWHIGSGTANRGSKSLYISNTGGTTNAYTNTSTSLVYAYKEVSLSVGGYAISFDWKCYGESSWDYLRVFLAPDSATITAGRTPIGGTSSYDFVAAAPPAGWIDVVGGKLNLQSSWQSHYLEFNVTTAGAYKLVFFWGNDGSSGSTPPAAVDNIVLELPTCPRPAITNLLPTSDSAYFNWRGTGSSYLLEYADSVFTPCSGQATLITVTDTAYALDNLTPNTTYYYALTALCDGNDSSMTYTGSFITECVPISLPIFFGVESTDSLYYCMDYGRGGTDPSTSYPALTSTSYEGDRALYIYAANTGAKYWAVMPATVETLDEALITFYARSSSVTANAGSRNPIQIGYMTNPADENTFVSIYTLDPNATVYSRYTFGFPDTITYPANARAAMMVGGTGYSSTTYYYIDNITMEPKPTCPYVKDLAVSGTTVVQASLTWNYEATASPNVPTEYEVAYAPTSDLADLATITTTDLGIALTGLAAGTEYKVWVTPSCGAEGYGNSDSATFSTKSMPCILYDPATVDTVVIGTGTSSSYSSLFPSIYYHRYQQNLYTADEIGDTAMTITKIAFQRPANAADIINITNLEIYMANTTQTSLSSAWVPYSSDFVLVKAMGGEVISTGSSQWWEIELEESFQYTGGSLLVAVNSSISSYMYDSYFIYTSASGKARYAQSDGSAFNVVSPSTGSSTSTRPNIRFVSGVCDLYSECAPPAVTIDSICDTAARITWVPGYQETEWDVYYRLKGATTWHPIVTGTPSMEVMLGGLTGGTKYEVAVMGICEDSLMGITNFTTDCGPIYRISMPYTAPFTTSATGYGKLPNCWVHTADNSDDDYPYMTTLNQRHALYFYYVSSSYPIQSVAMPVLEMAIDSLEMTFDIYKGSTSYDGKVIVGVMDHPDSLSSFVGIDTIHCVATGVWTPVSIDFSSYTGTGHYIVLRAERALLTSYDYDYVYVSNVQVMRRSSCRPLTSAYASNITYESADINVIDNDNSDANGYKLYYGTVNDINAVIDSVEFTGTTSLSNLNYLTTYYCWVKVLCSEENSRYYAFSFNTAPPCALVENLTVQISNANGSALLSWNEPSEGFTATGYVVRYKNTADTTDTWIADTTTNFYYHITGLVIGGYEYEVTTLCDSYNSDSEEGSFNIVDGCIYVGAMEGTNSYAPFYGYYNYGYTQSLYLSGEMSNMGDTLYGITYTATDNTVADNFLLDIYVANTTLTDLSAGYYSYDSLTLVVDSFTMAVNGAGEYYIPFDTPFVRDANRNIVIAVDNNTGDYFTSIPWVSTSTTNIRSRYLYRDESDYDPATASGGSTALYIPDVKFDATCVSTTLCGAPLLTSPAQTATSIDLRWFAGGAETAWTVDYRLVGDTVWTNSVPTTTQTTYTITGLTQGNNYEVKVSHMCNGTPLETTATYSTKCGLMPLPYVEDFNAQPAGTYARACWQTGLDSESGTLPLVRDLVNFGPMMKVHDGDYIVAPDFNVPISDIQVNLTYWGTSAGSFMYVGVVTDASAIQSFIPIDTLYSYTPTIRSSATVHFNNYTDTIGNICFYIPDGYLSGEYWIDNIIFEQNSSCPNVDSIWTVSTSGSDATIAWATDGIGTANSYTVEYYEAGTTNVQTMTVTSAQATLNNLNTSSDYMVVVTPSCSGSHPSIPHHLRTDCAPLAVPYTMNFDLPYLSALTQTREMPTCWNYAILATGTSASSYYDPQIYSSTSYATSGSRVLYLYYRTVVALPEFTVPIDSLQLSFHATSSANEYGLEVGVVDSITPGFENSFVPLKTIDAYSGVWDTVRFCNYATTGRYIAFRTTNSNNYNYSYVYIDDVTVDYLPSCIPVENIKRTVATTSSITAQWTTCGNPQGYEVEYGAVGFERGQGTTLTTTTNTATLTGLAANTPYDVYIRTNCGNGDYSHWVKATLRSGYCDNQVEVEMFDSTATTTTSYFPGYATYNFSYTQVIYDSAMLVAAGVQPGAEVAAFAFYPTNTYSNTYYTNMRVFMKHTTKSVFASDSDLDTVSPADLVYTGDMNFTAVGWREVIFDSFFVWDGHSNVIIAIDRAHGNWSSSTSFKAQSGSTYRAIYRYEDGSAADPYTLSNICSYGGRVTTIPAYKFVTCAGNICGVPAVSVTTTYNDATLNWTSEATNFEVAVKAVTDATWPTETAVANAYSYVATGLQPATAYQYRVRAICEEELISNWAEGTFTTDSLPCFAPSNLTATPGLGNAEMNWTNGSNETEWNIHVWNTAFDQTFNVTGNPATVTGLTPGTEYYAAIQAVCGGGMVISDYGDTISFTTDVCDPVTNVTATVEGSTATVTWTAGDNNTGSFLVEYGYEGFAAGTGTTLTATSNSITITDLEDDTRYEVYVRAVCEGQYNSVWSSVAVFEIGIDAVNGNNAVTIYPNPAEQSTTIRVNGVEGIVSVTIVDMTGRTVSTSSLECSGDCEKLMNVTDLAAGSYFVRLQGNGLDTVKKLVIK